MTPATTTEALDLAYKLVVTAVSVLLGISGYLIQSKVTDMTKSIDTLNSNLNDLTVNQATSKVALEAYSNLQSLHHERLTRLERTWEKLENQRK